MILDSISISGFRSIDKAVKFHFDSLPTGLIFVQGENRVEKDLGSNGAGKSTIFEAVCWILFGKTSRNLKAKVVKNWGGKQSCKGTMRFRFEETKAKHKIERSWKPNTLKFDNETTTQEKIEEMLDVDFQSFLYSIYISQFGSKFFELDPSHKLNIFTSIIGSELNKWNKYSEFASKKAKIVDDNIVVLEKTLAKYEGSLDVLDVSKVKSQISEFEKTRNTYIDDFESTIREKQRDAETYSDKLKTLIKSKQDFETTISTDIDTRRMNDRLEELRNRERSYEAQVTEYSVELRSASRDIEKYNELKTRGICPTCGTSVERLNLDNKIRELTVTEARYRDAVTASKAKLAIVTERIRSVRRTTEELLSTRDEMRRKLGEFERDIEIAKNSVENTDQTIELMKDTIKIKLKEVNPYKATLKDTKRKIALFKRVKRYTKDELKETRHELSAIEFWKKAYKEIRLIVIKQLTDEFEIQINNNLQALGMPDWYIELSVESETSKGDIKREFVTYVKSPHGGGKIPLEAWSGGEGQRLKLAGTLGLMDFIHNRRGTDWNVEFFDEPFTFLSGKGDEQLVDVLQSRAKRLHKSIMIVDHGDVANAGKFSDVISVIKTEEGTIIK